jgi:hypothetical protein
MKDLREYMRVAVSMVKREALFRGKGGVEVMM